MSVGVIGDKCDRQNVISVGQGYVGSVGVNEYDGFFIVSFIRELGVVLCCCAGIKFFLVITNVITSSLASGEWFVLGNVVCLYC